MNNSGIVSIDDETVSAGNNSVQPKDDVVEISDVPTVENIVEVESTEISSAPYEQTIGDDAPTLESVAVNNLETEEVEVINDNVLNENVTPINDSVNGEVNSGPVLPPVGDIPNGGIPGSDVPPVPPVGENPNVSSVEPIEYDEVPPYAIEYTDETRFESYFDGKMLDYMAYTFLRGAIIGITAGIGKPWADTIFYEYKFHHTIYNGKRLKFVGKPTELFVERYKWIFFTIITFGIYALWIPLKKQQWIAKNTYFADEDIIPGESFFDAKLLGMIGVNLLTTLLSAITFGIMLPFSICYKRRWMAKHTVITRKKIIFKGRALPLLGNILKWCILSLITFGIYALWVPIKKENWFAKNTFIKLRNEDY